MIRGLVVRRLTYVCVLALGWGMFPMTEVMGQTPPPSPPPGEYVPHAPGQTPPAGPGPSAPEKAPVNPVDEPLAWLYKARHNYTAVRDYTGTLRKQERVNGLLQEENAMLFSFRAQPFSVYMKWLVPAKSFGQEVVYVEGRNNNKMRVKSRGLLGGPGVLGFISVATNDPRIFQHSNHTIKEAGIGNMIEQLITNLEAEKRISKSVVRTADFELEKRPLVRVEITRPQPAAGLSYYRTVVFLDRDSKYPIRMENYGWPVQGGPAAGELMEMFSYTSLQFNVGLRDAVFEK